MKAGDILGNLSIYMMIGFILGLLLGDPTGNSAQLSMIILGFIMMLSMSDMIFEFGRTGSAILEGLLPALMTFGVLTPIFLAASFFFSGDLRLGWMLTAAVPAAVAIVPYSERMNGDVRLALHGEIAIYLMALALTPIIAIAMLEASVNVLDLLTILLLLILIPMGLSRIIRRMNLSGRSRGTAINLAFLVFFFIVVGANRSIFFGDPLTILALAAASFITVFGTGHAIDRMLNRRRENERRTLTMFSTIKNTGLAIAVALSLNRAEMALPATMLVIFEMIWIIYLSSWKYNHRGALIREYA